MHVRASVSRAGFHAIWLNLSCSLLQIPLVNGGTATVFWGFVLGVFGFTFVYASLAEMASMCDVPMVIHQQAAPTRH